MISTLPQDLRFAARTLRKSPGFTAAALITIAVGIGANTAVFSVVNGVLLRPLPYEASERLVAMWEMDPARGLERENVSQQDFAQWQAQGQVFDSLGFWTGGDDFNVVTEAGLEKVGCAYASAGLFQVLRVRPLLGRTLGPREDIERCERVALISEGFWQRRLGGDPNVLGRTITIDTYGRRDYAVVGVLPHGFDFPGRCDVWLPAGWNGLPRNRNGHWLSVIARLRPGVTAEAALAEVNVIQARLDSDGAAGRSPTRVAIVPLLAHTVGTDMRLALLVLWGVVGCVLLIACANVANLLLARAASRQKEIAVRVALGAGRWHITRQLLTECLLLALAGGALGVLLANWGLDLIVALGSGHVPRLAGVALDSSSLAFTLIISLATGVLFGLAPAWLCSRGDLNAALKGSARGASPGRTRSRLRAALVVTEVALSLVLLIAAGLMTRSLVRLARLDRGYQTRHVLTAELDFSVSGYTSWVQPTRTRPQVTLQRLIERLSSLPGVEAAAAASTLPRGIGLAGPQLVVIDGRPAPAPGETDSANFTGVGPEYFRALGIRLLRGRPFSEGDTFEAPAVAVINDSFARRYFPGEDPLGKRLALMGRNGGPGGPNPAAATPWSEVVGVVSDVRPLGLRAEVGPEVYVPYWQWPMQRPTVLMRTMGDPSHLARSLSSELQALNAGLPAPTIRTMDELVADTVARPRLQSLLLGLFGATALGLAAVGIYAVMAQSVLQRSNEIGIRMALGAPGRRVLALVIGQGMKLALAGIVAGIALALALTHVMRNLLFEVAPTDPVTFGGVSGLLCVVALLACWLPARRAARADPMQALRHE